MRGPDQVEEEAVVGAGHRRVFAEKHGQVSHPLRHPSCQLDAAIHCQTAVMVSHIAAFSWEFTFPIIPTHLNQAFGGTYLYPASRVDQMNLMKPCSFFFGQIWQNPEFFRKIS